MHLFSRVATLSGPPRASMAWATEITAFVNARTSKEVALWSVGFGQPLGTVVWSTWVDGLADIQASFAGLMDDEGYHALLERGRDVLGTGADQLRELVHGEPSGDSPPIGAVTSMTTATIANGKYEEALRWGAEMAGHVAQVTGSRTLFLSDVFGAFGQVTWLSGALDAAAADAARAALNADLDYLKRVADAGDLFVEGSARSSMATRIA